MNVLNEQARFEELYRHEVKEVYRFVYARVGNHEDAHEIVQESFLKLYQLQQQGEGDEHERALLFRLARNRAIDLLRRRRTRENFGHEAAAGNVLAFRSAGTPTPEDVLLDKERHRCAATALEKLTECDKDCLSLRRNGLSYREVAEVLGVNPNSVGQIINRALRRFTESYEALLENKENEALLGKKEKR